jgi:choline dehydrogenase-like flavoprotein
MFNSLDGVFRWGPADRTLPPWPREDDGVPVQLQTAGVGGNTLHYIGNSPRAYPSAIDDAWPIGYEELVPYYEKVESLLPVLEPERIAARDELFITGCEKVGIPHAPGRDVRGTGWRLQPNAVGRNCTGCGHCLIGCAMPEGSEVHETAKRGTNASYAPMAVATGRCEIRTECFATKILMERGRARGVRYRRASGDVEEVEAPVVVLAGGAIETPRLWLNSELPANTPVGRYLTIHWPDFLCAVAPVETEPYKGMQVLTRADIPGYGFIEPIGTGPMNFALTLFGGTGIATDPAPPDVPWRSKGMLWGSALKRRVEAYPRTLVITLFCDDEAHADSRVTLAEPSDDHGRIPRVVYRATPATVERREWLARKAAEVLVAAGSDPDTIHRSDLPGSTIHQHGTMRMGRDPSDSVTDEACETHEVRGVFVADCSVLPNGIGGPNPTLTCQALATRTAGKILERHFDATPADAKRS